jgi:toxin-antitoxin system PIN domain toxin
VTTYLLDANVLIALTVVEHEHHARASSWAARVDRFALCPVVEGALVRFLVQVGESVAAADRLLRAIHAMPRCEFWPDRLSYVDADLRHVRGHRQVTDAYLVSLVAARRDATLATLDEGLRQERPELTLLVPPL